MAGLLGEIFSSGDRMKRKLRGLLDDPMGTIALGSQRMSEDVQQMGLLADESGYMPGMNSVLLTPEQKARARKQLADKGAEMGAAMIGTTKFTYPQEKALAEAQRNAAKPVSKGGLGLGPNNTPAERAAAMGMEDAYHGSKTPQDIKNLMPGGSDGSIRTGDAYGMGVYSTTDAVGDASSYGAGGAVFPLKIDRSNHLRVDAPNANDLERLSKFSGEQMPPSDKARFSIGREERSFKDVQEARDFFSNQRENWKQFGGGFDRAKPEAIAHSDGTFAVQFTNFDAPVPITNGADANTLLKALGWDNIPALGYSGHTLDRGAGRMWDVTTDTSKLRSRFAAFDPMRRNSPDLLAGLLPFSLINMEDRNGQPLK